MMIETQGRQFRRTRQAFYGAVITIVGLAMIELFARVVEPAAYRTLRDFDSSRSLAEYKLWQQALFSSFGGVHQPDPELLWKFRPRLRDPLFTTNSRNLLGSEEIADTKPPNTVRILLLGDSSPVGLGLHQRDEAFGEIAARLLQAEWRGRKHIELINAAVSGYTSEQGKRFLESQGIRYRPDVVVCHFGNNDASINGYLSDRDVFAAQTWARAARTVLYRFATYRLLRGLVSPVLPNRQPAVSGLPRVRVSAEEFSENLGAIAATAKKAGARTVFINPPIPYRWPAGLQFKFFSRMTDGAGEWVVAAPLQRQLEKPVAYCLDSETVNRPYGHIDPYTREVFAGAYADQGAIDSMKTVYFARLHGNPDDPVSLNNLGVLFWRQQRYDSAISAFQQCLMTDSSFNVSRYNLGITLADTGDTAAAAAALHQAADRDYHSLRIKTPYRRALYGAAAAGGAVVLDAARLFAENDGERLFIDHCHPTPEGHRLIARQLAGVIDSLLRQ